MATHSSVLAWRIPGTEKPGRLQSVGSHRVRSEEHTSELQSQTSISYAVFCLIPADAARRAEVHLCPVPVGGRRKAVRDRFALQGGTGHFPCTHWRRKWQPTPVFLPGESHGQRSLVGCSPWGCTESDTTVASQEGCQGTFRPSGRNRGLPLRRRRGHP